MGESMRYKQWGYLWLYWNFRGVCLEHIKHKTHGTVTPIASLIWRPIR
jgi:hypothetical protein